MSEALLLILFLLPAFLCVGLCFVKDTRTYRKILLNAILLINAIVYVSPLLYAYWATRPDGNMWSENGPGAALWLYFIILPVCGLVFITLFILKLVFRRQSKITLN